MAEPLHEALHEAYDVDVAKLNRLAARSAERAEALKAENDRLRELVTEAIRLMQADGPDCGLCKHYSECWTDEAMDYSPSGCVICTEARELGIEVDA